MLSLYKNTELKQIREIFHGHLHVSLSFVRSTPLISDNILPVIIKYCNDCLQNNLSVLIKHSENRPI